MRMQVGGSTINLADLITSLYLIQSLFLCLAEALCRFTIPTLIGVARAMGRIPTSGSPKSSLLCSMFPPEAASKPNEPVTSVLRSSQVDIERRTFNTFRCIVPRTLSMSILSSSSPSPPRTNDLRSSSNVSGRHRSPSPVDSGLVLTEADQPYLNSSQHYLCNIGTSFPQVARSVSDNGLHLEFTAKQLEGILTQVSP
jgi:hypothetical protein